MPKRDLIAVLEVIDKEIETYINSFKEKQKEWAGLAEDAMAQGNFESVKSRLDWIKQNKDMVAGLSIAHEIVLRAKIFEH